MAAQRPQQIVVALRSRQIVARGARPARAPRPTDRGARPSPSARARARRCCPASAPPARRPPAAPCSSRASTAGWSGTHWNTALPNNRSVPGSGIQVARSACDEGAVAAAARAPAAACRARNRRRSPRRSETARSAARWSCRARSRDRPRASGLSSGTCASRSRGGRVRSSSNLRYWRADQSSGRR